MSITVYWSVFEDPWMRAKQPQPVMKEFYERRLHEEDNPNMAYHRCPFLHDYLKKIYSLHSMYDFSFSIDEFGINSNNFGQDFFDNHVGIKSFEKRVFSFRQPFIFFTEENSLNVSVPVFPYLEDNNITKRCMPFTGELDIGKYFRPIDFSFFLKEGFDNFVIEKDEIFAYLIFDTEEKINFVQFKPTEKIKEYSTDVRNARLFLLPSKFSSKNLFYNNFRIKKNILKEIKENIVQ